MLVLKPSVPYNLWKCMNDCPVLRCITLFAIQLSRVWHWTHQVYGGGLIIPNYSIWGVSCRRTQTFSINWNSAKVCSNLWPAVHSFIWLLLQVRLARAMKHMSHTPVCKQDGREGADVAGSPVHAIWRVLRVAETKQIGRSFGTWD